MATEIVFVLDRSGSMHGLEKDVIGGFNSFVVEQQKIKDNSRLTTVLFDDRYEVLHDGIDLQEVKPITAKEYFVRGSTALLDAVGKAITTVQSHTNRKDDSVIFLINTDGQENASKEYTNQTLKDLVKECETSKKWKFVFIGANIDSFAVGNRMGIGTTRNYTADSHGTQSVYTATAAMTSNYRYEVNNSKGADVQLDTTKLDDIK
jgi:uncharacterized protein YegL